MKRLWKKIVSMWKVFSENYEGPVYWLGKWED